MILLLDAHALLWWLDASSELAAGASDAIRDPLNDVLVSASTIWEVALKQALGRLTAPDDLVDTIEAAGFSAIPVTARDAERAARLPPHHRDPFDRMLVAQALRLDAVIVSRDRALPLYGAHVLLA